MLAARTLGSYHQLQHNNSSSTIVCVFAGEGGGACHLIGGASTTFNDLEACSTPADLTRSFTNL